MSADVEDREVSALEIKARRVLARIYHARYFHKWKRTEAGWPYAESYYCSRGWWCGAETYDEERTEYGPLSALRFDLERVRFLRRAFHWYATSRWAR